MNVTTLQKTVDCLIVGVGRAGLMMSAMLTRTVGNKLSGRSPRRGAGS